jgi:putative FmdB family regulatory protein
MPIYEYGCARCGGEFEVLVLRRADEADVSCPRCGAREAARRLSRTAAPRAEGGATAPVRPCGPGG